MPNTPRSGSRTPVRRSQTPDHASRDKQPFIRRAVVGDRKTEEDRMSTLMVLQDCRSVVFRQGSALQTIRVREGGPESKVAVPAEARVLISPDGKQMLIWNLTSSKKRFIKLISLETARELQSIKVEMGTDDAEQSSVCRKNVCVTPDWRQVVVMGDTSVEAYSLHDGQRVSTSKRSTEIQSPIFSCVAPFYDNVRIALGHADKALVMVWSLTAARTERLLEGPKDLQQAIGHLEVSSDNQRVLGVTKSRLIVWEVDSRAVLHNIEIPSKEPHYSLLQPLKVCICQDWKWVLVRHSFGNALKVVDMEKGVVVMTHSDPNVTHNAAAISPNNRFLVTSDYVMPDTLTTGKVFMTFWDLKKVLGERWYESRGTYVGPKSRDGKRQGHGKCYFHDKSVYDGQWQDNERNGKGTMRYADGSVYEGDWRDDMRCGQGVCNYSDKSRYEGEWAADGREGKGTLWLADGSRYQGAWRDDRRHGEGKYWSCFGSMFGGDWVADRKHGHGTCTYTDQSRYEGSWSRDEWHGRGVLYLPDKSRYEGELSRARRDGEGRLFDATGNLIYDGQWKDNLKHGHGKLYSASGAVVYGGYWAEDRKELQPKKIPKQKSCDPATFQLTKSGLFPMSTRRRTSVATITVITAVLAALVAAAVAYRIEVYQAVMRIGV